MNVYQNKVSFRNELPLIGNSDNMGFIDLKHVTYIISKVLISRTGSIL